MRNGMVFLQLEENIYKQPTDDILLNGEKLKVFSLRSETRKNIPSHHLFSVLYWKSNLMP